MKNFGILPGQYEERKLFAQKSALILLINILAAIIFRITFIANHKIKQAVECFIVIPR